MQTKKASTEPLSAKITLKTLRLTKQPALETDWAKNADIVLNDVRQNTSKDWERVGQNMSLQLFHTTAREVPAYKEFLKEHGIDPAKVRTFEDFKRVPPVNKKNYLRVYPFKDLYAKGTLNTPMTYTSTSGSTGTPFYFARQEHLDWQYALMHELFLKNGDTKKSTLVIVGFGMGVWIGGTITFKAYEILGQRRGYPVSVLPAGINKKEIFNALKNLAPNFDQTIIIGYGPFMKDIVDEAPDWDVDLKKLNVRMTFAAEAFTENFRDYLGEKVGMKDVLRDTMNVYGTADIGAVAFETPLSILVRRLATKDQALFKDLFGDTQKTPTLAQFFPQFVNIEYEDDQVLLTGNTTTPLVRYAIGDRGGVRTYDAVKATLANHGIDLNAELKQAGIAETAGQMPFVFVYERIDLSTTLYGLQIYPEPIRELLITPAFSKYFTGKFTLITKFDEDQNQYLEVNLEQKRGQVVGEDITAKLQDEIIATLLEKNSEYRELHAFIKERSHPRLVVWPAEDPLYFKPGVKQAWVKK